MTPEPESGIVIDEFGTWYERAGRVWNDIGTVTMPLAPNPWTWQALQVRCGKLEVLYP